MRIAILDTFGKVIIETDVSPKIGKAFYRFMKELQK